MTTIGQNIGPPVQVFTGDEACEGRVDFRYKLDFSTGLEYDFDFAQWVQQGTIKSVQSFYINNFGNAFPLTIRMGSSTQVITIPPGAQAYMPVLQPNSPSWSVSCTNAASVAYLHVLNFFVPPYMWGQTLTVDIASLTAVIVNGRLNVRTQPAQLTTDTDRSGTITAGGAGQVLMVANAARLQWTLQNPSTATEILQFSKIAINGPWYDLIAGGEAGDDGTTVYAGTIWVKAATTGHAFTSDEGA